MDSYSDFITWFNGLSKKEQKKIKNIVKNDLLQSGKYYIWLNCQYAQNFKMLSEPYGIELNKKYEIYLGAEDTLNEFEKKCCKQIYDSNRARIRRLRKKLDYYLTHFDCTWYTLTFRDDVLDNTSHDTRRTYISRYLKNVLKAGWYAANIDYGDKEKNPDSNEREHYHALSNLDFVDLKSYPYGFIFVKKISKNSLPIVLSKYINKLTAHAYKDSTKGRDRLIYSR